MSREPFADLPDAEFPLADRLRDESMSGEWFELKIESIDTEKRVCDGETDSLVAVQESMIIGQGFHQRCCFMNQVVVVSILRAVNGCF